MLGTMLAALFTRPWARRIIGAALAALAVVLFLVNLRRAGERAGRAAERLENLERTHAIQRQILEAASRRPRSRNDLVDRLRSGEF
ncbi:hypothetical protein [Phaeovulum veldkampii]|nr:hypothetical protein [Phaeovulum veldkampii]TDQ54624.1 hypothetical protein EV658_13030 [Phaeovulum veldkampii DSM 11550]